MSFTQYRKINRDDHTGVIQPVGGWMRLGKSGMPGMSGVECADTVVSVEQGLIMGWGDAKAIGRVRRTVNGDDDGLPPVLALLS